MLHTLAFKVKTLIKGDNLKQVNFKMCSSSTNPQIKENTYASEGSVHPDGLANEVIDTILRDHPGRGLYEESSSFGSSTSFPSGKSKAKVDRRLDYWKNMIIQRRALQERLRNQLGRTPEEMILNYQAKVVSHSVKGFVETVGLPRHSAAELLGRENPKKGEEDRGTISSFVDEWETMALGLDEQYFKLELLRYLGQPSLQENGGVSQKNRPLDPIEPNEELKIVEIISKRVRTSKYLKDSLYMQTYNLLCDTAEDIVSVIESTSD